MSTPHSDRLRTLLEPLAVAVGLYLEQITVTPAGKRRMLRVVVDSDAGAQLDTVAELSRKISEVLDESDAMGGAPYVLEVSSPGTDRPLTEPRHFARNTGRLIKAQLADGGELIARIVEVGDEGLDVEVPGVKGRKPTMRRLSFAEIVKARVELEFSRKSADGVDDGEVMDGGDMDGGDADELTAEAAHSAHNDGADDLAAADTDESPEEA